MLFVHSKLLCNYKITNNIILNSERSDGCIILIFCFDINKWGGENAQIFETSVLSVIEKRIQLVYSESQFGQ